MKTFPIVDPKTGHVVHLAVVRDADGKTHLLPQPASSGYSTDAGDAK